MVKRVEYGNVVVDVGRGEAILRRDQLIPRELFRNNDRVRAYIRDVRSEVRGPQIFLSRTASEFMAELFKMEVPEIYDGIIEIRAVARDPGSPWNEDVPTFLVNALQPAEVTKVVLDEDAERIEVVVPDDQLSLAIGRRGQNVRLASQLTGLDIDIMTEAEESERRQAEFAERSGLFMTADTANEIQARARDYLDALNAKAVEQAKEMGVEQSLFDFEGLTPQMIVALAEDERNSTSRSKKHSTWS